MGIDWVEYNDEHKQLETLVRSVDRSGDYCVHGKLVAYMPRLEVSPVGTISFPVPDVHAASLIRVAERAPYGRGTETVLDTNVRDCWQIDSAKVQLGGAVWDKTFASILAKVAQGLGCPRKRLSARLYKLLVYETGGFFTAHRDSEKAAGMVATLVVVLPAVGEGGELVVRHKDREKVIDMCVSDPYELAYAAFYADCSHETLPLRAGHRVSLVYNVILSGKGSDDLSRAPDFAGHAKSIAAPIRLEPIGRGCKATRVGAGSSLQRGWPVVRDAEGTRRRGCAGPRAGDSASRLQLACGGAPH